MELIRDQRGHPGGPSTGTEGATGAYSRQNKKVEPLNRIAMNLGIAALLTACSSIAQSSKIGAFEVGRIPGEAIGTYGALTGAADKGLFGRICTLGKCAWTLIIKSSEDTCYTQTIILSVDNRGSSEKVTCSGSEQGMAAFVFAINDTDVTRRIYQGVQMGISFPTGDSHIFNVTGAEKAVAALDKLRQ